MDELLNNPYAVKAMLSLGLGLVVFLLTQIALRMANKRTKRTTEAISVIKYTAICFFGFALVFIWLEGITPILTALTIVAAALTIVSKELILNFLGSFVIFWRELFAIGDRVQVGDFSGDVIDKGVLYFTLLEVGRASSTGHSTGRLVKIPNALALTLPVVNATRGAGYVWHEAKIAVTRNSDWEKAKDILLTAVDSYYAQEDINLDRIKQIFEKKRVFFKKLTPRAYLAVSTGGIEITVRYLCRSRMTRESQDYLVSTLLQKMKTAGVELADEQPS